MAKLDSFDDRLRPSYIASKSIIEELDDKAIGPSIFNLITMIGKGSFGEVYLVEKKTTGEKYAMKVLHKRALFRKLIFIKA